HPPRPAPRPRDPPAPAPARPLPNTGGRPRHGTAGHRRSRVHHGPVEQQPFPRQAGGRAERRRRHPAQDKIARPLNEGLGGPYVQPVRGVHIAHDNRARLDQRREGLPFHQPHPPPPNHAPHLPTPHHPPA